ncbi:hypothetical protein EIP86_008931, partial [Pleurotus ostreatoroseus]
CQYANARTNEHQLESVIRVQPQKLLEILEEARAVLSSFSSDIHSDISSRHLEGGIPYLVENAQVVRKIPAIDAQDISHFEPLWTLGIPMVVDVSAKFNFQLWSPSTFIRGHEQEIVRVIKQTENHQHDVKVTLREFVQMLTIPDTKRGYAVKLKVAFDYPPSATFENLYYDHFEAFQRGLPFSPYTGASGFHNLAAHFPVTRGAQTKRDPTVTASIKPDIGPKMYIATADRIRLDGEQGVLPIQVPYGPPHYDQHTSTIVDNLSDIPESPAENDFKRQGSTKLHLDMSSAVNIMVADVSGEGSLWIIFAAEDTEAIRRYLRKRHGLDASSPCPIHSQNYYFEKHDLRKLFHDEGVLPYIHTQKQGQAIFIPVGCAHQVSNNGTCIKIATDFVSLSLLHKNWQLAEDFHNEGIEDVLGLEAVLLHAWFSVKLQRELSPSVHGSETRSADPQLVNCASTDPFDTVRTRKKANRFKRKHLKNTPDHELYHCPDPGCASKAARERLYTWANLHKHITCLHHRKLPPLGTWEAFELVPVHIWKAWYIRRIRKQVLEDGIRNHL